VRGIEQARRRFTGGVYLLWYPIKDLRTIEEFQRAVASVAPAETLAVELFVRVPVDAERLNGSGLIVINPPYTLRADLEVLLPVLAERLAEGAGARAHVAQLG
jgi:23S rRNA (adenine2030-N6)-methyltransferase